MGNSIVIGDLGLARSQSSIQKSKHFIEGTCFYMSPECIEPSFGEITPKVDIWLAYIKV